jgi:hypothetical protein
MILAVPAGAYYSFFQGFKNNQRLIGINGSG